MEIPRGRGVLKIKILEGKYEAKLEFPGGRGGEGCKTKTFHGGEYGYILELSTMQLKQNWEHFCDFLNNYVKLYLAFYNTLMHLTVKIPACRLASMSFCLKEHRHE